MASFLNTEFLLLAQTAPRDISRFAIEIIVGTITIVSMLVVLFYIRQMNTRHQTLLAHLENELAERLKAQEALMASEGFYHSLVESLPAAILRKNVEGCFTFGNQKFYAALEVSEKTQLVGKTDLDFFPKPLAEKYRADDHRVMESLEPLEVVEEHVNPHGEKLYVQVLKTPLIDPQGRVSGVQGIFWDVTARKRAEEQLLLQNIKLQEMAESERQANAGLKQAQSQLVQQEKLASLGLIVAGVAHEINNPVAFVTNNVAVLGRDVGEMRDLISLYEQADSLILKEACELSDKILEFRDRVDMAYTLQNIQGLLDRSRDGLSRIQQIVSHLRLFAHLDEGEVNEADLNHGIESTAAIIIGNARKKDVKIELELSTMPSITCHAAKINQVIMNLLTNAIDACYEGGKVTVQSRSTAGGIEIEITDTGCGMDSLTRDRIFDPFFTTKPIGQGTGLGLSISYGIIKDHGGSIVVESALGEGSRFTIKLPLRPISKHFSPPQLNEELGGELAHTL